MGMGLRGRRAAGRRKRAAGRRKRAAKRRGKAKDRRKKRSKDLRDRARDRRRNRLRHRTRWRRGYRRHSGGSGGGVDLCSLFMMCCGCGDEDPIEINKEEIADLRQTQELILIRHNHEGTVNNTSVIVNQPSAPAAMGFQTGPTNNAYVSVHQPSAPSGFQTGTINNTSVIVNQPSAPPPGFQNVDASWGPPPDYDTVMATTTQYPGNPNVVMQQPITSPCAGAAAGPSSEFSSAAVDSVVTPGTFSETVFSDHQTKQLEVLSVIRELIEAANDADTLNVLHNQYNEIVEQMKQMDALGYTYPGGVPQSFPMADSTQQGPATDIEISRT